MGNLNNQCLNSNKLTDSVPIICEIFNDRGTYITSCYAHDTVSYIKQCYVESCDPPPLPANIIFKLLANPSFSHIKPSHMPSNSQTEQSNSSSPAFSFVSNSSNQHAPQRVVLLDDCDTMLKYTKYSLSSIPNHKNTNSKPKRLIFQIRIEHISSKKKHANAPPQPLNRRNRSNSTSTTINTNTMRQMYHNQESMTPSDAYSVVSVESNNSQDLPQKTDKNGIRRKKYRRRRKVTNESYVIDITDIDEVKEIDDELEEEKSNIPLGNAQHGSCGHGLDQLQSIFNNIAEDKETEQEIDIRIPPPLDYAVDDPHDEDDDDDDDESMSHTHTHTHTHICMDNKLQRESTSINSYEEHSFHSHHSQCQSVNSSVRRLNIIRKHNKQYKEISHTHSHTHEMDDSAHIAAIPVVSSSDGDSDKGSVHSLRSHNIHKQEFEQVWRRGSKSRKERKRSYSFCGGGAAVLDGDVFPLSLIYGKEMEGSCTQSYYHEHSYDNAMKFSFRKVKLSRRSNKSDKEECTSYSEQEYCAEIAGDIGSESEHESDSVLFKDENEESMIKNGVKLALSDSQELQSNMSENDEHDSISVGFPQHIYENEEDMQPQSMKLDMFKSKGKCKQKHKHSHRHKKFKRVRNVPRARTRQSREISACKKARKEVKNNLFKRRKHRKKSFEEQEKKKKKHKKTKIKLKIYKKEKEEEEETENERSFTATTTFKRIEEKLEMGQIEPGSTQYQRELDDAMNKLKKKHKKIAKKNHKNIHNNAILPPLYDNKSPIESSQSQQLLFNEMHPRMDNISIKSEIIMSKKNKNAAKIKPEKRKKRSPSKSKNKSPLKCDKAVIRSSSRSKNRAPSNSKAKNKSPSKFDGSKYRSPSKPKNNSPLKCKDRSAAKLKKKHLHNFSPKAKSRSKSRRDLHSNSHHRKPYEFKNRHSFHEVYNRNDRHRESHDNIAYNNNNNNKHRRYRSSEAVFEKKKLKMKQDSMDSEISDNDNSKEIKKQYKQNKHHSFDLHSSRKEGQEFISKRSNKKYDKYERKYKRNNYYHKSSQNIIINDKEIYSSSYGGRGQKVLSNS